MLKITDGRDAFFQWDTAQTLTVENEPGKTVAEVHIGHEHGNVYSFEPVDGVVTVPDELLQCSDKIVAFEWIKIDDGGYTTRKYTFRVAKRPKVDNYTYTPTKAQSWEYWSDLAKSYAERAELALSEVPGAMRDYWREHKDDFKGDPGPRGETGPQGVQGIPGVAGLRGPQGEPGRDGRDGKDGRDGIDAHPYDDTEIRSEINSVNESITELSEVVDSKVGFTDYATADKGGVFKVNNWNGLAILESGALRGVSLPLSTYNNRDNYLIVSKGTLENVLAERLKEPQFELIEEITLTEDATQLTKTAEPNGTPYHFKKLHIVITTPISTANGVIYGYANNLLSFYVGSAISTTERVSYIHIENDGGFIRGDGHSGASKYATVGASVVARTYMECNIQKSDSLTIDAIKLLTTSAPMPIGTNIKIYGIRA